MNKFYFKHRNIGLDPDTNKITRIVLLKEDI